MKSGNKMKTTLKKICPKCKKKIVALWQQAYGMRIIKEIEGKDFYGAKCPECNHEWSVKK